MPPAQEAAGATSASCCLIVACPGAAPFECSAAEICGLKLFFAHTPQGDMCLTCLQPLSCYHSTIKLQIPILMGSCSKAKACTQDPYLPLRPSSEFASA